METVQTCQAVLSEARELAKHTIHNLHSDVDSDEIMSHTEATTLYRCVMTLIEINRVMGDK